MKRLIFVALMLMSATVLAQTAPCKGKKADGTPCKMVIGVKKETGYCSHHNPNKPHCGAIKKDKTPCKMPVKAKGERCRFHPVQ